MPWSGVGGGTSTNGLAQSLGHDVAGAGPPPPSPSAKVPSLTDLLETHRADEVTTRDLARAAGVSERTVYRHFPDRQALLDGLSDRLLHLTGSGPPGGPIESVDDLSRVAVSVMAGLDEFHAAAQAEALLNADPRRFSPATRENTEQLRRVLSQAFPDLDEREYVRIAAVIRCLLSSQVWLRMREEFGIPGTESGPTVAWVLDTIFDALRRGQRPGTDSESPPRRQR